MSVKQKIYFRSIEIRPQRVAFLFLNPKYSPKSCPASLPGVARKTIERKVLKATVGR